MLRRRSRSRRPGKAPIASPRRSSSRDRHPALVAVVLGELVDVHLDEPIGDGLVDPAAELERILERLVAMVEAAADRLGEHRREVGQAPDVPARDVDAERQRQARLEQPPFTQIEHLVQAEVGERQLALVDQQPERRRGRTRPRPGSARTAARGYGISPSTSRSVRNAVVIAPGITISLPRRSSTEAGSRPTTIGPYPAPMLAPCGQQGVVALDERIGGERDRRHLEPSRRAPTG